MAFVVLLLLTKFAWRLILTCSLEEKFTGHNNKKTKIVAELVSVPGAFLKCEQGKN